MAWILAGCSSANSEKSSPDWGLLRHGSLDAVVDATAHINVKPPRLTKQGFGAGVAVAIAVAGGLVLGATCSAGRAKKEWGVMGVRGGYGSGFAWK